MGGEDGAQFFVGAGVGEGARPDRLVDRVQVLALGAAPLPYWVLRDANRLFQFSLALPAPVNGIPAVEFGVECLWVQDDTETGGPCWAGFQIIDISDTGTTLIEQLMNEWTA